VGGLFYCLCGGVLIRGIEGGKTRGLFFGKFNKNTQQWLQKKERKSQAIWQ